DQLLIFDALESAREFDRALGVVANQNARPLNPAFAQDTGQLTGINPRNPHDTILLKVIRQRLMRTEVGYLLRAIANDQTCDLYAAGFVVFGINARVANMRVGKRNDLAVVAGIGQNFLVTRHGGIEQDFGLSVAVGSARKTPENSTISQ